VAGHDAGVGVQEVGDLVNPEEPDQPRQTDPPVRWIAAPTERRLIVMANHNFTLIITGPVNEHLDDLFEAGCSDALIGEVNGVHFADFDRKGPSWLVACAVGARSRRRSRICGLVTGCGVGVT
jgi:hypothetical protein